ncbi:MAG: 4-deoxy-4-formamido-L-arabinose-phosphoundecaprenol deformylase [Deltaproteobacteria bacterium]|nr:4-deoxy-4-formamido-L-arabinose-phosphoundecaprenol deformylase [Deltaproteobacteria bacterium]
MVVGLRIDVDTFRGTRFGVPNLCNLLDEHNIPASFFFSVGPDNMGRHIRRLIRPAFFFKMLRTKASKLYGWDMLLRGTFKPGPVIGKSLGNIIRSASDAGHEVGLHAWDHHYWQMHLDTMNSQDIYKDVKKGVQMLTDILGSSPICSAVPSWKCNDLVLIEKSKFSFKYNSDCRGETLFRPLVEGREIFQPQIPVTLPTYDEVIGHKGLTDSNYNDYMLSLIRPKKLNVLTIHAEVEGISNLAMFQRFVKMAKTKGISFVSLGIILKNAIKIDRAALVSSEIAGRDGWVSCQAIRP